MKKIIFKNLEKEFNLNENKTNLFQKVMKVQNEKDDNTLNFEDLNLKIGKIVKVQKVVDSTKLYVLEIDFKDEVRQIVSGLQKIYSEIDLINRKIVGIVNLKPAKLAGIESCGMILAVDNPKDNDDCSLLSSNLEIGENLKTDSKIANSKKEIKIKSFLKYNLYVKNKKCYFNDLEIFDCFEEKGFDGKIR